jgi:hypothetical protein
MQQAAESSSRTRINRNKAVQTGSDENRWAWNQLTRREQCWKDQSLGKKEQWGNKRSVRRP